MLSITGGGTGAFNELLRNGGGSDLLVEGIINYSPASTHDLLGGEPEHYSSAETARRLAVTAYNRCVELGVDPIEANGVAATSKLGLTNRAEREGRVHDIHIAHHTHNKTSSLSLELKNTKRTRQQEEWLCQSMILDAMYHWYCDYNLNDKENPILANLTKSEVYIGQSVHSDEVAAVISGKSKGLLVNFEDDSLLCGDTLIEGILVFPGSFNPIHDQHKVMARVAKEKLGKEVWLELSVTNTDKSQLDFISVLDRIQLLSDAVKGDGVIKGVVITNSPLFRMKAEIFPQETVYITGTDTWNRIGDCQYGNPQETVNALIPKKQAFLVFSRKGQRTRYPHAARGISMFVSDDEYSDTGLSSTEIRNAQHQSRPDSGH